MILLGAHLPELRRLLAADIVHVSTGVTLGVIVVVLGISVMASRTRVAGGRPGPGEVHR